ncbi:MAG: patatin-like phospholipase family protein, partial [Anaerolineales bacterium]|nr:patatin-like phospholipase family protein [Anaerolineales bacterium]
ILMELQRLGIQPDLITGTSIGGMVGALVAAGLSTDDMIDFFRQLTVGSVYGLPGGANALSTNGKIRKMLEQVIGDPSFADLSIPLAVVTTDLVSRREVILDEGSVIDAVLATIALPIVFPALKREKQVLVDGGLLNNVPFDIARARGATYVIAVSLANAAPYGTPVEDHAPLPDVLSRALAFTRRRPFLQILSAMYDIWTDVTLRTRLAISQPDILLEPELGTIGIFDTHRMDEGLLAGRLALQAIEPGLLAKLINPEVPIKDHTHVIPQDKRRTT